MSNRVIIQRFKVNIQNRLTIFTSFFSHPLHFKMTYSLREMVLAAHYMGQWEQLNIFLMLHNIKVEENHNIFKIAEGKSIL
jgi:hypothetical protein